MVGFSASPFAGWTRPNDVAPGLLRPFAVDAFGLVDPVRLFIVGLPFCRSVFVGDDGVFGTVVE